MFRVKQGCCGCSLGEWILFLLWADVILESFSVLKYIVLVFSPYADLFSYICLAGLVVKLSSSVCGIVGVNKKRRSLLIPFLGAFTVEIIVSAAFLILLLLFVDLKSWLGNHFENVMHAMIPDDVWKDIHSNLELAHLMNFWIGASVNMFIIFFLVGLFFDVYIFIVVYSHYESLREEKVKGIKIDDSQLEV